MSRKAQVPRRITHARRRPVKPGGRAFDYALNYQKLDLRKQPELYRVGVGEQGVLLVEPYKSEILPHWKFRTPRDATVSARTIAKLFRAYRDADDFVGMDMARKFLQMGYTRARRYANHRSGVKYTVKGKVLPREEDPVKAASAEIFFRAWQRVERNRIYKARKAEWRARLG